MNDLYSVLNVSRNASSNEIRNAYRNLAMKYHPDKNDGNEESEEKFKEINYAYSILSDNDSRNAYNENIKSEKYSYENFNYEKAYNQFFSEMYSIAVQMTFSNIQWQYISSELQSRGCPKNIADIISKDIESKRKTSIRKQASALFGKSIISIILGIVLTWITFEMEFQFFVVFWGLIIYGIINFFRSIYYISSGKAPKSK